MKWVLSYPSKKFRLREFQCRRRLSQEQHRNKPRMPVVTRKPLETRREAGARPHLAPSLPETQTLPRIPRAGRCCASVKSSPLGHRDGTVSKWTQFLHGLLASRIQAVILCVSCIVAASKTTVTRHIS